MTEDTGTSFSCDNFWGIVGIVLVLAIVLGLLWMAFFLKFVDKHEIGFVYHRVSGEIEVLDKTGWIIQFKPLNNVHAIDMRPYQVHISANQRILNAKLVRFNPEGILTFIEWYGREAGDNLFELKEILKCHAFDKTGGQDCPFLEVVSELAPPQSDTVGRRGVGEN